MAASVEASISANSSWLRSWRGDQQRFRFGEERYPFDRAHVEPLTFYGEGQGFVCYDEGRAAFGHRTRACTASEHCQRGECHEKMYRAAAARKKSGQGARRG